MSAGRGVGARTILECRNHFEESDAVSETLGYHRELFRPCAARDCGHGGFRFSLPGWLGARRQSEAKNARADSRSLRKARQRTRPKVSTLARQPPTARSRTLAAACTMAFALHTAAAARAPRATLAPQRRRRCSAVVTCAVATPPEADRQAGTPSPSGSHDESVRYSLFGLSSAQYTGQTRIPRPSTVYNEQLVSKQTHSHRVMLVAPVPPRDSLRHLHCSTHFSPLSGSSLYCPRCAHAPLLRQFDRLALSYLCGQLANAVGEKLPPGFANYDTFSELARKARELPRLHTLPSPPSPSPQPRYSYISHSSPSISRRARRYRSGGTRSRSGSW